MKMDMKKFQKGTETWFIGVVGRFAYIIGVLALIYGLFMAPMFMASNFMIMAVLFIGVGVYVGKVYKKKTKKGIFWG